MKKVAFYTLGCKLNFSETATISRMFEKKGYSKVDFTDKPDIYIINTCSVTENADKKCRKVVKEAKKISPDSYVAILGCYAQLKPKEIANISGVDAVLGATEKFQLLDLLDSFVKESNPKIFTSDIEEPKKFISGYSLNDRTRTFLKVQDGCDYSCTFCTIPMARGESRSDTLENVLKNALDIARSGVKEIVLTGINLGDYGIIDGERALKFIDLIKELNKIDEVKRFRISSIEPNLLTNEVIEFVAQSQKFVPHFHIPLQSGSDLVLKSMRRRYKSELYVNRVKKIKNLIPECCIGVDVIVGFPGESKEEFLKTYQFLNELDISYLHIFPYSERTNTLAANMENIIPIQVRHERSKMLRILSEKKKRAFYEKHLGANFKVLFENDVKGGKMHGFTENYIRVSTKFDPILINEIKSVKLSYIDDKGLMEVEEVEAAFT